MNTKTNVKTVGVAGGVTTLAFWVLGYFAPDFMQSAPTGAEAALTTVLAAIFCYFVPSTVFDRQGGPK